MTFMQWLVLGVALIIFLVLTWQAIKLAVKLAIVFIVAMMLLLSLDYYSVLPDSCHAFLQEWAPYLDPPNVRKWIENVFAKETIQKAGPSQNMETLKQEAPKVETQSDMPKNS